MSQSGKKETKCLLTIARCNVKSSEIYFFSRNYEFTSHNSVILFVKIKRYFLSYSDYFYLRTLFLANSEFILYHYVFLLRIASLYGEIASYKCTNSLLWICNILDNKKKGKYDFFAISFVTIQIFFPAKMHVYISQLRVTSLQLVKEIISQFWVWISKFWKKSDLWDKKSELTFLSDGRNMFPYHIDPNTKINAHTKHDDTSPQGRAEGKDQ